MSKSIAPSSHEPEQGGDGVRVGVGEGPLAAAVGETQGAPEALRLLDGRAGLGGHLDGVEDDVVAQDGVLELLARGLLRFRHRPVCRTTPFQLPRSSVSCRWTASTRGMSWSRTDPCVLASLMTSVPQPSIRSMMPMS